MSDDGWVMFDDGGWQKEVMAETEYARQVRKAPCNIYMNVYTGEVEHRTVVGEEEIGWEWKDKAWEALAEHAEEFHDHE